MIPRRIERVKKDAARPVVKDKPRLRSTAHRDWVRSHHCCVEGCERIPIEVAHVNRSCNRGMSQKASDGFTISLCRDHHSESHRGEKTFERKYGIDLMELAKEFYMKSPHRNKLDDPYGKEA